jgi:hypothetical protein
MADDRIADSNTDGSETARIHRAVTADGLVQFTRHEEPV